MVGSAIVRELQKPVQPVIAGADPQSMAPTAWIADHVRNDNLTIVTRTHAELDLCNQAAVQAFFEAEKPTQVYLAAAKVGAYTLTTPIRPTSSTKT